MPETASSYRDPRRGPWPKPETEQPDDDTLMDWLMDDVVDATDGCQVEPDGMCEHGHPSWLIRLGLI